MLDFLKKKLTPKWQFQKPGTIWLSQFLEHDRLLLEHRSGAQRSLTERKVSFALIDLKNGTVLWQDFTLTDSQGNPIGDEWWVGIELVHKQLFFLHGYTAPRLPEHKGLWAFDSDTHRLIWKDEHIGFICRVADELLVYRAAQSDNFSERDFFIIDALSGKTLRQIDSHEADAFRNQTEDIALSQGVTLPTRYSTFTEGFNTVQTLAQKLTGSKNVIAGYDVINSSSKTILGYHQQSERVVLTQSGAPIKALSYKLFIIEHDKVLFSDTLGDAMSGLLTDGFFIRSEVLYYTKNQDTLVALELLS